MRDRTSRRNEFNESNEGREAGKQEKEGREEISGRIDGREHGELSGPEGGADEDGRGWAKVEYRR